MCDFRLNSFAHNTVIQPKCMCQKEQQKFQQGRLSSQRPQLDYLAKDLRKASLEKIVDNQEWAAFYRWSGERNPDEQKFQQNKGGRTRYPSS